MEHSRGQCRRRFFLFDRADNVTLANTRVLAIKRAIQDNIYCGQGLNVTGQRIRERA